MSTDKKLIQRKISLIKNDLQHLRKLSLLSLKQFLSKAEHEALAERFLERIIGRMIDINYHILVEDENLTPVDYYTSFIEMGKKKYVSQALAKRLANSAGLRNRLAHEYDEIDEKKIYKAMQDCLKDVPLYLHRIIESFEENKGQKKLMHL